MSKSMNKVLPNGQPRVNGAGRKRMTVTNLAPQLQMNIRGQMPRDLRHIQKPEDSDDETDEIEDFAKLILNFYTV